jgi:hypothetical protein
MSGTAFDINWVQLPESERAIRRLDRISLQLIHELNLTVSDVQTETPENPHWHRVLSEVTQMDALHQLQLIQAFRHEDMWDGEALVNQNLGYSAAIAVMRRIAQLAPRRQRPATQPPAPVSPSGRKRRFAADKDPAKATPSSMPRRHLAAVPDLD